MGVAQAVSIATAALKAFDQIPKGLKPLGDSSWITYACCVSETGEGRMEPVAYAYGNKSLPSHVINEYHGLAVHDSHAEVLCRRATLKYCIENRAHVLAQKPLFHLFVSHPPCGSFSILNDTASAEVSNVKRSRLMSSVTNTGAKLTSKEADSAEDPENQCCFAVRRKPGRGEPSLSHCCSDKLMRWAFLGFAGTLLWAIDPKLAKCMHFHSYTFMTNDEEQLGHSTLLLEKRLQDLVSQVERLPEVVFLPAEHLSCKFPFSKQPAVNETSFVALSWCLSAPRSDGNRKKHYDRIIKGFRQGVPKKSLAKQGASSLARISLYTLLQRFYHEAGLPKEFPKSLDEYRTVKMSLLDEQEDKMYKQKLDNFFGKFSDWIRGHSREQFVRAGGDEKLYTP